MCCPDPSVQRFLNGVGISRTAFHKHFLSKDHPMLEVLEVQNRFFPFTCRQMLRDQGGRWAAGQLRAD